MSRSLLRLVMSLSLIVAFVCTGFTAVYAGTTGALSGKIVDNANQTPIVGAKVTATSPSGSATTTSDKNGSFTFLSLAPDTYALSVSDAGYDPATLNGITVQADQTATFSVSLAKTLKTIGRVQARSNASLIQPGISTDVYNISAAQQSAAATLGGGGGLNNAYSAVASVPGVFVPQGQVGQYQSIFVRGANYTQVGYEYDGVPIQRAFDQYPGGNLSNLGTQEVQVYVGTAPTGAGSTALAGFVNQVIRAGTYPGSANLVLGAASPTHYSNLRFEGGGASPNRNFSYYVGAAGYNQNIAYGDRPEFAQYAAPIDVYRNACGTAHPTAGCYKGPSSGPGNTILGPNGYELGPLLYGSSTYLTDRDNVVNLHLGIPHKHSADGLKDDIQFLYNNVLTETYFASAPGDWGQYYNQIVNGTAGGNVPCPVASAQNCNRYGPNPLNYNDKQYYLGNTGVFLTPGDLTNTQFAYFPNSQPNRPLNSPQAFNERDNYQQNGAIVKLQYQHNINSRSYARIAGYTEYSDWLQYGEGGLNPNFNGSISQDYKLGSHTRGVDFNYANQITDKHLLNFTFSYVTSNTFRNNDSGFNSAGAAIAYLVDSTNPTSGVCYSGAFAPVSCTAAATSRYVLPTAGATGKSLVLSAGGVPITALAGTTCGGGPCQYFTVATGNAATYNTVVPKFTTFALSDKFQVSDKLSLDLGIRYDDFKYALPSTTGDAARQLFVNNFNRFNCYDPVTQSLTTTDLNGKTLPFTTAGFSCSGAVPRYTSATFSQVSAPFEDYPELQPRVGLTYSVNRNNVIRANVGKSAQPSSSAFQQYNTIQPNLIPGPNTSYYNLGFTTPSHHILPEESYNYDTSWEHQFNGSDASFKFTPYVRTTKNEISTVLLDPKTNFVGGINIGRKNVKGLEFEIQKGDLNKDGFFGQLAYTYTFARITFDRTPKGTSVVDGLNNAIKTYNGYTSFCASNPTDARCGTTSTGVAPAACYTPAAGAVALKADPACAPGDIANPYFNAGPQNLFDPNGRYPLYNTYSGSTFASGSNQSYIPPHILTFIGNYKHGRLNITPTAQFQGGAQYGIPLGTQGIDPVKACAALPGAAATTAGDPRYPGPAIAALPYDASSCVGSIPIPNTVTHQYDPYGSFTEPNKLSINLSTSYEISKHITARLDFVNIVSSCFGGSNVPWKVTGAAGCDYGRTAYVGNFYNPGDAIQSRVSQPYGPVFGNVFQSTTAGQANPFQVFGSLNIKL